MTTHLDVEIWSDIVCPWCYIGKRRLERALADFEHADQVRITWRSYLLDPTAPARPTETAEAMLARKYGRSPEEARAMMAQVEAVAAEEGLDYRLAETMHLSTVDAHRLLHLAAEHGGEAARAALKERLLAAYFLEARDVSDPAVLTEEAVALGLPADRVAEVLAGDEYADRLRADIDTARRLGATGVPFFVLDRAYGISGAQPVELFTQTLQRAWDAAHPAVTMVGTDSGAGTDPGPDAHSHAGACGPDGCAY